MASSFKAARGAAGGAARSAAGVALLLLLSTGVAAAVVALLGGDPRKALLAIHAGSVGSPGAIAETLVRSTPLILTGLSVAVAFRGGVWNIGAEGQFIIGMLGTAAAGLLLPKLPAGVAVPLCLAAGVLSGALWAAGPAFLRLRRGVPEVISTIMLNFLAVYLGEYLVRGPLREPGSANDWTPLLPEWTYFPRLGALLGVKILGAGTLRLPDGQPVLALSVDAARLHIGVLLALAVPWIAWLWLSRSAFGFRLRAAGLNPEAAHAAGLPVGRTVAWAFLLSGGLAGLGGAIEMLGLLQRMYRYDPGSPGYGYSGIAVALLGQLHPLGTLVSALFFGGLAAGCNQMQRSAGISFHTAYVIQAVLVMLLVGVPRLGRPRRNHSSQPGQDALGEAAAEPSVTHSQPPAGQSDGTEERNGGSMR